MVAPIQHIQMEVSGADSPEFLEAVSPIDLQRLKDGSGMYN